VLYVCLCVCICWRAFVCCLRVAEIVGSGYCQAVYLIEKPALWSREAAASVSAMPHFCSSADSLKTRGAHTSTYTGSVCPHASSVCWFAYHPRETVDPFYISNETTLVSVATPSMSYCSIIRQVYFLSLLVWLVIVISFTFKCQKSLLLNPQLGIA